MYSASEKEDVTHLTMVMQVLEDKKLYANWKKCEFGKSEVAYLGHKISARGVAADLDKIKAMNQWAQPKNLRELRGFLGLTGYYRKFIAQYAQIAHPLTQQLKKDSFGWSGAATKAFEKLKKAMVTAPVLAMPNFELPFVVETDASGHGVGAVLMQQRPVAYFSRILGPRAQGRSIYEKEMMAMCLAVQRWKHYLLGRHFIIRTDQQSLRFVMQQREVGADYQKWVSKLIGFDFEIQYKPGFSNRVADALSRKQEGEVEFGALVATQGVDWTELQAEVQRDSILQRIIQELQTNDKKHVNFSIIEGRLLYKGRYVIPRTSKFVQLLLKEYHDSPVGGHSGELKTYLRLAADWHWYGMRKDVAAYVQQCVICQQHKTSQLSPAGLLQPLPLPELVWDEITMDFIEGLPSSKGYNTILVVVDRLTKFAHFISLKHPFLAYSVAAVFIKEVVRLHGFPSSIISDRDRIFMSNFWKEFFRLQGTSLKRSSAYHPQSDGESEIVNKCLETYLRCFASGQPRTWVNWLHWAEFWYNTSPHLSTKMSPFKALYGRDPPFVLRIGKGQTPVDSLEEMLQERESILDDLRFNLLNAQQRMKRTADVHR